MARQIVSGIGAFALTVTASLLLIILGLVYFIVTLWIVKIGSDLIMGKSLLDANWAVLSAAIIAVGSMIGSAMK